jgi:hypothetical protein
VNDWETILIALALGVLAAVFVVWLAMLAVDV